MSTFIVTLLVFLFVFRPGIRINYIVTCIYLHSLLQSRKWHYFLQIGTITQYICYKYMHTYIKMFTCTSCLQCQSQSSPNFILDSTLSVHNTFYQLSIGRCFPRYSIPTGWFTSRAMKIQLILTVLVTTIDVQWEGMGDVGSVRYEPALLPP